MNIDKIIKKLPEALAPIAKHTLQAFSDKCHEQKILLPETEKFQDDLARLFVCSKFIADNAAMFPQDIIDLLQSKTLRQNYDLQKYQALFRDNICAQPTEESLIKSLRLFRRRQMLRIAIRDLLNLASLEEIIGELSAFADSAINTSLDILHQLHCEQWGEPLSKHHHPQHLIVIAVGKLGTYELNFSSDIDLIFCFSGIGHTHGKESSMTSEQFFYRLGQRLINVLSRVSVDGPAFRVDMRLRPYGSSGSLVTSIPAMGSYYQEQGREWERFALAKARVTNDGVVGIKLMETIKQFVYRRYVDYGAIESLRQIKQMIRRESQGLENDIKRGEGGIREVEFIAQVFQLIRGGQEPWLQEPRILKLLPLLAETGCLPQKVVTELFDAYGFLRTTEHRLQEFNDQQTHSLPQQDSDKISLAYSMGYQNWQAFEKDLSAHRHKVTKHFNAMIAPPKTISTTETLVVDETLLKLTKGELSSEQSLMLLKKIGFFDSEKTQALLITFRKGFNYRRMDGISRKRLHALLQQLLPLVAESTNPVDSLTRIMRLLEVILRRSVYLVLLLENPLAMVQLVELCSASPWIADQLIRYPFLLDELLNSETLYIPYGSDKIRDQLRQYMLALPAEDLEQHMECLRRFKQAQVLRVAASDITGALPLMKVSDHLTNTADVIVGYVQRLAWRHLVVRHGHPLQQGEQLHWEDFAIIAYGKLGGIELGYGSDLDLVFLHDAVNIAEMTDGDKPITCGEFYMRLAQRIIHILSTATASGVLYDVDTRLRPSGASGLLVSSFNGFAEYQQQKAWTWEHQALVRARVITGSKNIAKNFEEVRHQVISGKRKTQELKTEIATMRQKMRHSSRKPPADQYDVDQGVGGIKDIEFIVQFGVLSWAHKTPDIFEYTDNIRILEAFAQYELMTEKDVKLLSDAYCAYREVVHRSALQNDPAWVDNDALMDYRQSVEGIWNRLFSD